MLWDSCTQNWTKCKRGQEGNKSSAAQTYIIVHKARGWKWMMIVVMEPKEAAPFSPAREIFSLWQGRISATVATCVCLNVPLNAPPVMIQRFPKQVLCPTEPLITVVTVRAAWSRPRRRDRSCACLCCFGGVAWGWGAPTVTHTHTHT